MKIAIIGGGPAGVSAGIASKHNNNEVTIFESNSDLLKKLLLTGSGRCNIGNINNDRAKFHSYQSDLIDQVINDKNIKMYYDFLDSLGLVLKNKNGYLYPFSEKSTSVKSCLVARLSDLGVDIRLNTPVLKIDLVNDKFLVNDELFDKVIITTGSYSYPKTGSTGDGYQFLKQFNHHLNPVNPSLVPCVAKTWQQDFGGKRCEAIVRYKDKEERGELQLTKYGLSGICIFNLSRDIKIDLENKRDARVYINFMPWLEEDYYTYFAKRDTLLNNKTILELCDGFMDYSLVIALFNYVKLNKNKLYKDLKREEKELFIKTLTNFEVEISDTLGFTESQACSGGICLDEINLDTMESTLVNNLYMAGDIIDLDGDCGGYNLTIAFITGILAGASC